MNASGDTTWQKFVSTLQQIPDASIPDAVLSIGVIALILGLGKVSPRIPGPLIAVVGSIILASALDWEARREVEMVGALPGGLPAFLIPSASLADVLALVPTALIILLVQVAQRVSTASAFAIQHDDRHDPNRDLTGLGMANIANGLFSSFVVNGSPTKTAISDRSGTRSQMAMVVLASITIPVLLFLTGVFDNLPEATLATVVFVIAVHLMKIDTLRMLYQMPTRGEFPVAATTAAFVALAGVGGGILYAIVASIVVHLAQTSRPNNSVLHVEANGTRRQLAVLPGAQTAPGLIVYRFAANLFYANSARLVADVRELLGNAPDPVRVFVLDASEIHSVTGPRPRRGASASRSSTRQGRPSRFQGCRRRPGRCWTTTGSPTRSAVRRGTSRPSSTHCRDTQLGTAEPRSRRRPSRPATAPTDSCTR